MDKPLRNTLRLAVTRCRKLLEEAVADALQGKFGIGHDGTVEGIGKLGQLTPEDHAHRGQLLAHLEHIRAAGYEPTEAVAQLVREVAFTHLNRLAAFKLMEQRKLIREAVSRGLNSNGFMFYMADHTEDETLWSTGQQELAYRHFLIWQGATLPGVQQGAMRLLFAANDPANALCPPQRVLDQVLDELNGDALKDIWLEDETIGWIYQYFTPKELRDQVRKESAAPRNGYELAFRNQFYTPRYVVQFLAENTLGHIWFAMMGRMPMHQRCAYFVLPQVDARSRPRKDPRDLKILDPACGSGHFLLYCFDLLGAIYEESWNAEEGMPKSMATGRTLREDYPTLNALHRAIPGLILRDNLHGIDIDLRATQIASLALWLRAQRDYQEQGVKASDRPTIEHINIACAEPMPGEISMLDEAVAPELPAVRELAYAVFAQMELAGEAGTLLKIEETLREPIQEAKGRWLQEPQPEQLGLPLLLAEPSVKYEQTVLDLSGITDAQFFDGAEDRVLEALRACAQRATNGAGFQRGLFARDAERGFAFIDLCRKSYDVVLMNPPFGAASKPSQEYIEDAYPRTKNDLYAAFVERGLSLLQVGGMLGAITSRTGFFLTSFQKWREEILLKEARLTVMADLGYGVLDTAMVETAAYCLEKVKP